MKYKSDLKADEICAILKTCGESGVAELKFGRLHVSFGKPPTTLGVNTHDLPEAAISDEQLKIIETTQLQKEELSAKQDRLARMILEDPAEFERLAMAGELEDGPATTTDYD